MSWFDLWDIGKAHALLAFESSDGERLLTARESIHQALAKHGEEEGHDQIMRAKILHSLGETYLARGSILSTDNKLTDVVRREYESAYDLFRESHELFGTYSGQECPLTYHH